LLVASFTIAFEDYDLASGKPLRVEWPQVGEQEIQLRARGLRWKLYYRMDTVRQGQEPSFTWPTSLLAALNIPQHDVGIMGWTRYTMGNTERQLYLPLRITQTGGKPGKNIYHLVLFPGVELQEVFVSLATVNEDGQPASFLQDGKPLRSGFYPAQRRIDVSLAGFPRPGFYYVEIGATLQRGGATSVEFVMYHPGE
jgi:hypothetical protein